MQKLVWVGQSVKDKTVSSRQRYHKECGRGAMEHHEKQTDVIFQFHQFHTQKEYDLLFYFVLRGTPEVN